MTSETKTFSPVPRQKGFKKWVKLSLDDLPLIRPPKYHMVCHVTGGLVSLFKKVQADKKSKGNTDPDVPSKTEDQLALEDDRVVRVSFTKYYLDKAKAEEEEKLLKEKEEINKKEESKKAKENVEDEEDNETSDKDEDGKKSDEDDGKKSDDEGKKGDKTEVGKKTSDKEEVNGDESKEPIESSELKSNGEIDGSDKENSDSENKEDKDAKTKNGEEKTTADDGKPKKDKETDDEKMECDKAAKEDKEDSEEDDDEEEEEEDEDELTTEHTDEDGEFVPLSGMPLLAGRYKYIQVLGRGQSALIIKAEDTFNDNKALAIKVLHKVYKPIGSQEADILLELHRADPYYHVPFARVKTQFLYGPHYCLVFDALSPTSLYTHYELKDIRGAASIPHIRQLAVKLLTVMGFLNKQNVIHADLKPENILLANEEDLSSVMVVDFGNALRNTEEELSLYYSDFELQTLLYRAPEVIFGLRFSLEVDMWSLGCLLAECYIGKPLFMGKTKNDILSKMYKLLGPFPKEFSEGECGEEFSQFIGKPLSRYERIQNLTRRLNKCNNHPFLTLLEKMLTYLPEQRMVPSEAACHPFIAYVSPYLYLTPTPGLLRYPTVIVDESTYPLRPIIEEDEEDESTVEHKKHLKHLLSFAHALPPVVHSSKTSHQTNCNNNLTTATTANSIMSINRETKTVSVSSTGNSQTPASRTDVNETLKSMGLRCEDFTISVYSKEQAHAILRKQGVEVTNHSGRSGQAQRYQQQMSQRNNSQRSSRQGGGSGMMQPNNQGFRSSVSVGRTGGSMPQGRGGNVNRGAPSGNSQTPAADEASDDDDCVILDPPVNSRPPQPVQARPPPQPRLPQQFQLMGTTVQVNRGSKRPYSGPQNPMNTKRPNRGVMAPYQQYSQPQQYRHVQQQPQQRYSGSSSSRHRQQQYQQQMYQQQYLDDYSDEEDSGDEASVQDTLKRLKDYNISITCRRNEGNPRRMQQPRRQQMPQQNYMHGGPSRNSSQRSYMHRSQGNMMRSGGDHRMMRDQRMMREQMMRADHMMRSDSDYEDDHHMDSEEDTNADMAKYLECEIGEDGAMGAMVEGEEELHFNDEDEDDMHDMPHSSGRSGGMYGRGVMPPHRRHMAPNASGSGKGREYIKGRGMASGGGGASGSRQQQFLPPKRPTQRPEMMEEDEEDLANSSIEEVAPGRANNDQQRIIMNKAQRNKHNDKNDEDKEDDLNEDEDYQDEEDLEDELLEQEEQLQKDKTKKKQSGSRDNEDKCDEDEGGDKEGDDNVDDALSDKGNEELVDKLLEKHLNAVGSGEDGENMDEEEKEASNDKANEHEEEDEEEEEEEEDLLIKTSSKDGGGADEEEEEEDKLKDGGEDDEIDEELEKELLAGEDEDM